MIFRYFIPTLAAGFVLDLLLGDPEWLCHPVILIGKYISWMEKLLRKRGGRLRISAVFLTVSTVLLTMGITGALLFFLGKLGKVPLWIGMSLLDWMGIAARSMVKEAKDVEKSLERSIENARKQVSRIVGRDTASLNEADVIRAAVETVAENTTDGVISPMIYAALGGPVALWGFKAASTLDSMVGYLDPHYRDIGWSSAVLDDVLNFLPARLTGVLLVWSAFLTGLDGKNAWRIMLRDHANHKSPNCAWSEAAAAGALHIQLGGTHQYFGKEVRKPTIGDPDREPAGSDIEKTCRLLITSGAILMAGLLVLFLSIR